MTPHRAAKWDSTPKVAALASVKEGLALVQKSARPDGQYPDGTDGRRFSRPSFTSTHDPKTYYQELEILGQFKEFYVGTRMDANRALESAPIALDRRDFARSDGGDRKIVAHAASGRELNR